MLDVNLKIVVFLCDNTTFLAKLTANFNCVYSKKFLRSFEDLDGRHYRQCTENLKRLYTVSWLLTSTPLAFLIGKWLS